MTLRYLRSPAGGNRESSKILRHAEMKISCLPAYPDLPSNTEWCLPGNTSSIAIDQEASPTATTVVLTHQHTRDVEAEGLSVPTLLV